MTREELITFAAYVKSLADKIKHDDAMSGGWGSAGHNLQKEVEIFLAGLDNKLPKQWDHIYKQYQKENDPDYQEYQRLKKKFG